MHIITIDGKEDAGAYSVQNEQGEDVLYIFEGNGRIEALKRTQTTEKLNSLKMEVEVFYLLNHQKLIKHIKKLRKAYRLENS